MKTKAFWAGLCLLMLSACGPIIGSMMVAGNGVKDFHIVSGDLANLPSGSRVVVLGPFDKTSEAFYICRGEDASAFVSAFNQTGLFAAELEINSRFPDQLPQAGKFAGMSPADTRQALGLERDPDLVMSGTILSRSMTAAPANGVIMTAAYRLEFLNLKSGKTTVIEVTTQDMFQDVVPASVDHMARQISHR
jgi:hypothetical protein